MDGLCQFRILIPGAATALTSISAPSEMQKLVKEQSSRENKIVDRVVVLWRLTVRQPERKSFALEERLAKNDLIDSDTVSWLRVYYSVWRTHAVSRVCCRLDVSPLKGCKWVWVCTDQPPVPPAVSYG